MAGLDTPRIARAVRELLLAIGEDPDRAGLRDTPQRVATAYAEFFAGMSVDPATFLRDAVPVESTLSGEAATSEMVVIRDIGFRSVCEHHLLPFVGTAHIAYLPGARVVGLGRIAAVVDALAARPQLQERLTEEIADTIATGLAARGVVVVLDAQHRCVSTRSQRQARSSTVTLASRGTLREQAVRQEALQLVFAEANPDTSSFREAER